MKAFEFLNEIGKANAKIENDVAELKSLLELSNFGNGFILEAKQILINLFLTLKKLPTEAISMYQDNLIQRLLHVSLMAFLQV